MLWLWFNFSDQYFETNFQNILTYLLALTTMNQVFTSYFVILYNFDLVSNQTLDPKSLESAYKSQNQKSLKIIEKYFK